MYIRGKPIIKRGVHIVVNDGCKVWLDKSVEGLSEAQHRTIETAAKKTPKKHLLYMNIKWLEGLLGDDGDIPLHCPTCNRNYTLTRKAYEGAYQTFLLGRDAQ